MQLQQKTAKINLTEQFNEFQCPICYQQFDQGIRYPKLICQNSHYFCFSCIEKFFDYSSIPKCPFCKLHVNKNSIMSFGLLLIIKKREEHFRKQMAKAQNTEQKLFKKYRQMEQKLKKLQKENKQLAQKNKLYQYLNYHQQKNTAQQLVNRMDERGRSEQKTIFVRKQCSDSKEKSRSRSNFGGKPNISALEWVQRQYNLNDVAIHQNLITNMSHNQVIVYGKQNQQRKFAVTFTKGSSCGLGFLIYYRAGQRIYYGLAMTGSVSTQINKQLFFASGFPQRQKIIAIKKQHVIQWICNEKMIARIFVQPGDIIYCQPWIYLGQLTDSVRIEQ